LLLSIGCVAPAPGGGATAASPPAPTTSTTTCAGEYTDDLGGTPIQAAGPTGHVEDSCLSPEALTARCASLWPTSFGGSCPAFDAFVAAIESGDHVSLYGAGLWEAESRECSLDTATWHWVALSERCYDCGAMDLFFDGAGGLVGIRLTVPYFGAWCCGAPGLVGSQWIGAAPPPGMVCASETELVVPPPDTGS
jgi:hypothetical protein